MNTGIKILLVFIALALLKAAVIYAILGYFAFKAICIVLAIIFNREETPEEIAQRQEAERIAAIQEPAAKYYGIYQHSNHIPMSKWILMGREEKSAIYANRETMTERFNGMSVDSQLYFITTYGFDPRNKRQIKRN